MFGLLNVNRHRLALFSLTLLICTAALTVTIIFGSNSGQAAAATSRITQASIPTDWLGRVNYYRAMAKLPAVTENATWSYGDWLHCRYLVKNGLPIGHTENPSLPWYSAEGAAAGSHSNIASTVSPDSIDAWMQAPFHAVGIIDPHLKQVGYGEYQEDGLGAVAALDVLRGLQSSTSGITYPIYWPGNGTTVTLTSPGYEWPDPLTSCSGYFHDAGLPILLQIGSGNHTPSVTAHSFSQNGTQLESCVFDQTNYKNPGASDQQLGRDVLASRNAIVLIPKHTLEYGKTYTASITSNGTNYTWSFSVMSEVDITQPEVSFANLSDGSLVSGLANVIANATDDVGVTRVDFYVDGAFVSTSTSPPYSFVWDTAALSGTHTLDVEAYDAAGNSNWKTASVTVNNFTAPHKYLFTWYDQSNADWRDWVLMANPAGGAGTARTSVKVGKYTYSDNNLAVSAPADTPQFPGVIGGPVTVASSQPLITSQRVLYKNSFNEIAGMPATDLDTTYYFTWYDSNPTGGMKGDWILIGNQGTSDANVQVFIGGQLKGTYTVPVGDKVTPSYPNLTDGPVKVVSTNGQPLIVSQRVLFKDSFNEVLGMPASRLSTEYSFTWYDDKPENFMRGNWILIGNQDTGDAEVDVFIGGTKMGSYTVPEGGRVTPQYPDVMSGPVKVVSTNGKKFIVSQRILFKDSFEEFQGLTAGEFGTNLWFTWYDSKPANGMMGNWILVANTSNQTANVDIYVGATKMGSYPVPAGGEITPSYPNTMAGPVRVVSTNSVPVLATQRVIYLDSFNEIGGMQLR